MGTTVITTEGPVTITVRVTPNAKKESFERQPDGTYAARVTVPPVDGKANKALIKLAAKALGVKKSRITIVKGEKSRDKVLAVDNFRQKL